MTIKVLALQSGVTGLSDHRVLEGSFVQNAGSLQVRGGLLPSPSAGELSTVSAMVAAVAALKCVIPNSISSTLGPYVLVSDAAVNITFDPGEASVARVDRIIARAYDDTNDGSGQTKGDVYYLKGQASGAATAMPNNAILLYEVTVPAGASAGGGGIDFNTATTDRRFYTSAAGGIIPIANATDMSGINSPYDGMAIYRTDLDTLYIYDGTNFKPKGQISVANSAALSNVTNPENGSIAYARDTGRLWTYNGSSWVRSYNEPQEITGKQGITSQSSFTSTSYADIPGITGLSFTKARSDTKIRVDMKTLFFTSSAGSTGLQLGVRINGTDYDVAKGYTTESSSYKPAVGFAAVTSGLAAGAYTITARWKVLSGSGVINTNSSISELDWSAREVVGQEG